MQNAILEMKNIEKTYSRNKVLKGVSLEISEGEVVSLVGENGAGKSTLMNILFGMSCIVDTGGYEGEIIWHGQPVKMVSPRQAMNMGIGMVHQEFMLLPSYTVTENVKLNREVTKPNVISHIFGSSMRTLDHKKMREETKVALEKIHLDVDESTLVGDMPVGFRQFIEIAREIDKTNIKLIVFDEPTAVLTDSESQWLLATIKEISMAGVAVIFISHKLTEVIEISDRILVLRDGELVSSLKKEETDVVRLAKLMVGRNVDFSTLVGRPIEEIQRMDVTMKVRDLHVKMPGEQAKGVDIDIYKGEILGLSGLAGQGKLAIPNGIAGVYPASGEVYYEGEKLPFNQPLKILEKGICFMSEDRRGIGLLLDESIKINITLLSLQIKNRFLKSYGFFNQLDKKAMHDTSIEMVQELGIKCTSCEQRVGSLSGGNQQKVCLAKAVVFGADLLFVSEPTRGIDVGAKKVVLDYLLNLNREKGVTIVIASSELTELRSLCDRIAIVYDGKIKNILLPTDSDEKFGLLMSGLDAQEVNNG